MRLSIQEFIRRFLQHVLPDGFQRIRHYGLLSNRSRSERLLRCRTLLEAQAVRVARDGPMPDAREQEQALECRVRVCPACGRGRVRRVRELEAIPTMLTVGASGRRIVPGAPPGLDRS
jgi:hypothetical protein